MDNPSPPDDLERVRSLAKSVDCFAEQDFCLLAGITPSTADSWRKRRRGPAYVLMGNRYLYPKAAVSEFIEANVKDHSGATMRGGL